MKLWVPIVFISTLSAALASPAVGDSGTVAGISARDSQAYCTKCSQKYQACRLACARWPSCHGTCKCETANYSDCKSSCGWSCFHHVNADVDEPANNEPVVDEPVVN